MKMRPFRILLAAALCLCLVPGKAWAAKGSAAGTVPPEDSAANQVGHDIILGNGEGSLDVVTETTVNPDGSITTTVTNRRIGTVTVATQYIDGSMTTVETRRDGTVTTTKRDAEGNVEKTVVRTDGSTSSTRINKDGSTSTLEVHKDGRVERKLLLSAAAVSAAEKDGVPVCLPIPELTVPSDKSLAPTVTVTAPQGGKLRIEIPVKNLEAGVVALLAAAGGEIVRESVPAAGGLQLTVDSGAAVKLVNNAKTFSDVADGDWFKQAVDFCSARKLFEGTAASVFSPQLSMSRGMMVTILYHLEGKPDCTYAGAFEDVSADAYYAKPEQWASETGIVSGYGGGRFGPDDPVTREQLAAILWRYVGQPEPESKTLSFRDADQAGEFAHTALCWAQEAGILQGKGDGILDPLGTATRAETAQMMKNFMERTGR